MIKPPFLAVLQVLRLGGLEPGHTAENADKMGGFNIVHAFVTGVVTGK